MTLNNTSEYIQSLIESPRIGQQVAAHHFVQGRPSCKVAVEKVVPEPLQAMLSNMGITKLYGHQNKAIKAIRRGEHTVVATPTASGKSLVYNLSVFEHLLRDTQSHGLYIFPLKALTQDQHSSFELWARAALPLVATSAVYDGDTTAYRRKKIRQSPPSVVMTNPEMVHLALLPHHHQWRQFFSNLKLVVVDEVHTYRGLLGSHMAQVLRRLNRVCAYYGSAPTFVFTSATVANPGELVQRLCGMKATTVQKSEAGTGGRHLVLMDPYQGPAQTAILLLKAAMARELRTIVYTQSRKLAELITLWVQHRSGRWADKISVYRAGLLPPERRQIEKHLKSGQLLAVVSTSALELGIDIGDLDICILVGYPGSMIATWQRSGRVGRKGQEAALVMIAGQDALDQYFVAQPQAFFKGRTETAVVNPYNAMVLESHLICAAAELPFQDKERWLHHPRVATSVAKLEHRNALLRSGDGVTLHARQRRPHLKVDLRSAGERYRIVCGQNVIGELNGFSLYREAHPGAIYLHQGVTYLAREVDEALKTVSVKTVSVGYHTRVRSETDVEILEVEKSNFIGKTNVCIGKVKVTNQVTGYEKVDTSNGRNLGHTSLEVPPVIYRTDAVWFEIQPLICTEVTDHGFDLMGALHAAEHAAISIMPLLVLADRNDVGGLATPRHHQNGRASIFIYDGVPGGAGFSRHAFEQVLALLESAAAAIARCKCDTGCPACVHSPKCGSGNQPMDKAGAHFMLKQIAKPGITTSNTLAPKPESRIAETPPCRPSDLGYGVFDLETQRSAKEVGGWHMAHRMKVSCGVVYDSRDDTYSVYLEDQLEQLIEHLKALDLVVGFNSKRFDYQVLSGYTDYDFNRLPSLDLLELVHKQLGFRLSLDHLAQETLNAKKSGSGLDALAWWQQGEIDKITAYCRKDVKITRDLYRFARDEGYLIYRQKEGDRFRVPLTDLSAN